MIALLGFDTGLRRSEGMGFSSCADCAIFEVGVYLAYSFYCAILICAKQPNLALRPRERLMWPIFIQVNTVD